MESFLEPGDLHAFAIRGDTSKLSFTTTAAFWELSQS